LRKKIIILSIVQQVCALRKVYNSVFQNVII